MNTKTLWSERFGMLLASGSPGSALAYQLGCAVARADISHRNKEGLTVTQIGAPSATHPAPAGELRDWTTSNGGWLRQFFHRLKAWYAAAGMRETEAYLGQAQNVADLEHRMRRLGDAVRERRADMLR